MELQFSVSTSRLISPIVYLADEAWFDYIEPDDQYAYHVWINILKVNPEELDEEPIAIGSIRGIFFDVVSVEENDDSLFDVFDSISSDTETAYETLLDEDGGLNLDYVGLERNIFYLEEVNLKQEFQGQGVGRKVIFNLEKIINQTLGFRIGCIITYPIEVSSISDNEMTITEVIRDDKRQKQLRSFMRKLGYKPIGDSGFMYINTDYKYKGFRVE